VQYNILKREVDTNKQLYEGLLQRLKKQVFPQLEGQQYPRGRFC